MNVAVVSILLVLLALKVLANVGMAYRLIFGPPDLKISAMLFIEWTLLVAATVASAILNPPVVALSARTIFLFGALAIVASYLHAYLALALLGGFVRKRRRNKHAAAAGPGAASDR